MTKKLTLHNKPYTGTVQAAIFDWAGTTIDHGCKGPTAVFFRAFQHFGIEPSIEEIRRPMGQEKREHVRAMLDMPRLSDLWKEKFNAAPASTDVDRVFEIVQELMPSTLAYFSLPAPDCIQTIEILHKRGIKVGSCTGYSRSMMKELLPQAQLAGYKPDCLVTSDEVPQGRPWPWMCWLNCMRLGVYPLESVIKVGDTVADIEEGINAGHWSIAVTRTSNDIGLDEKEISELDPADLARMESELSAKFYAAGAHAVISSLKDLPKTIDLINDCLSKGEMPHVLNKNK